MTRLIFEKSPNIMSLSLVFIVGQTILTTCLRGCRWWAWFHISNICSRSGQNFLCSGETNPSTLPSSGLMHLTIFVLFNNTLNSILICCIFTDMGPHGWRLGFLRLRSYTTVYLEGLSPESYGTP
ncbi:hypothetical protein JB92DRAFT_2995321 [Gautieria morchelliformis]|nr:hypothetical protein JB92DRAFT_2995321 [Gautieria morchelliformis]